MKRSGEEQPARRRRERRYTLLVYLGYTLSVYFLWGALAVSGVRVALIFRSRARVVPRKAIRDVLLRGDVAMDKAKKRRWFLVPIVPMTELW